MNKLHIPFNTPHYPHSHPHAPAYSNPPHFIFCYHIQNHETFQRIKTSKTLYQQFSLPYSVPNSINKDNDIPFEKTIILTETDPNTTIEPNGMAKIYGTNGGNSITIGSGADVELINFPGENSIVIQSQSSFTVYRAGSMVILNGLDDTKIIIPATITQQSVIFNGVEKILVIDSGSVMIGNQIVNLDSAAIE